MNSFFYHEKKDVIQNSTWKFCVKIIMLALWNNTNLVNI